MIVSQQLCSSKCTST